MFRRSICVAAIAGALACASAAHAGLINGSFENTAGFVGNGDNTMSLYTGSTTMTGWTVTGDSLAWIGPGNPFGLTASNGSYFLDLTDYPVNAPFGGVSQTVATVNGATYALTFDLGYDDRWGAAGLQVTAGNTVGNFTNSGPGSNIWAGQTFSFVANGNLTAINLQGVSGYAYIGLDNVNLVQTAGPAGVPEPASWALMITGFFGLGGVLRRRRAILAA